MPDPALWMTTPPLAQVPPVLQPQPAPAPVPAEPEPQPVIVPDDEGLTEEVAHVLERLQLETTFTDTSLTGWLVLLGGIFGGLVAGRIAQSVLRGLARRLILHGWKARATVFLDAARPLSLALFATGLGIGLTQVAMSPPVREFSYDLLTLLYIIAIGWFLFNAVNLVDVLIQRLVGRKKTRSQLDDQLAPLVRKTLRLFLVVVFALFAAENVFDADIGAWLAGLGIAGLAVSLAAQDSLKNLFGSVTVFMDRPFAVGELIAFDGHTGTVEEIGFRSTRMRTLNGELVTIPNSKIVDSSLHNIGRRPHIRRVMDVTITYDTPPDKVEQAVQILRDLLATPGTREAFDWENTPPRVYFDAFNADSLNIKVFYWHMPADYWAYMEHAERFNLALLRAYEEAGIEFAFPTQTLYLADDPKRKLSVHLLGEQAPDGSVMGDRR